MNRTKRQFAISGEAIERHGVVSNPVAREMAQHVRDEAGATWAVSTTGYASQPGESTDLSAGSVYVGVAHAGTRETGDSYAIVEYHEFDGGRRESKDRIATQATSRSSAGSIPWRSRPDVAAGGTSLPAVFGAESPVPPIFHCPGPSTHSI